MDTAELADEAGFNEAPAKKRGGVSAFATRFTGGL